MSKWAQSANWSKVPEHMREGLVLYIEHGVKPGSFMSAVLSNDLRTACAQADDINRHRIWDIVSFLYSYAPNRCWGSPEALKDWVAVRGLVGMENAARQEQDDDGKETEQDANIVDIGRYRSS